MTMDDTYETNIDANAQIFGNADRAATQAYQRAMLNNEGERIALEKAKFAWQQEVQTAQMTGEFRGNPTQAAMQYYANAFGTWAKPGENAETLASQQQRFSQGITAAGVTGQYNGQDTLAAQKQAADVAARQAELLGYYQQPGLNGGQPGQQQQTLAGQQQQWSQGFQEQQAGYKAQQDYLNLLAGLRGPADYGQYLKVLGSTPNGLQGLVSAAAGQYLPGTGVSGQAPTPVSLGSFLNSAATGMSQPYQYQWAQGMGQPPAPPSAQTAYQQAQNAGNTVYGQQQQQAQQANPYTYGSPAGNNMQPAAQGTAYDQYMRTAQGLPPPNQISPQAYNNMTTTQRQMLGGMYEQQGYALQDVADLYKQSLPKYGSQAPQTGGFKIA